MLKFLKEVESNDNHSIIRQANNLRLPKFVDSYTWNILEKLGYTTFILLNNE